MTTGKTIEDLQKQVKELRRSLYYARRRADSAERDRTKLEIDRNRYREWTKLKFLWFVDIHAENKTPNMPFMLKDMTKLFSACEPFYWG